MEGPEIQFAEAVIDNGRFGQRTVRFETGRLAKQAAGSVGDPRFSAARALRSRRSRRSRSVGAPSRPPPPAATSTTSSFCELTAFAPLH